MSDNDNTGTNPGAEPPAGGSGDAGPESQQSSGSHWASQPAAQPDHQAQNAGAYEWQQPTQQHQAQPQDPYSAAGQGAHHAADAPASDAGQGAWVPPTNPGWSQQSQGYTWTPPAGSEGTGSATPPAGSPPRSGTFKWIVVALVSALIGGMVATGATLAADDNDGDGGVIQALNSGKASSTPATPSSIRSVLEKVQPAVVSIQVRGASRLVTTSGSGTGMIVGSDGLILTNAHVVADAASISVTLSDKKEPLTARLLGADKSLDSALIKVDATNLPTVEFANSDDIQVGDQSVAIGNALALPGGPSVTTGIISAKGREISDASQTLSNLIQTDAAINPGNSGGPLANMAGQVVGMNTAVIRGEGGEFQNIGFAMAINSIKPILEDLKSGKVQQQALLGVSAVTLTADIRERYSLKPEKGAVIDTVSAGSPAAEAGLDRFDVVVKIGDKDITTSEALTGEVRSHKPGDKVKITYYRGDDKKETEATLDARPSGN